MMKRENDLANDEIKKLVLKIAIPSMIAQFVNVLYSIVDRIYIGNIPEVGNMALAGVGVCGPIVTMVSSFAYLIGVGGAPIAGISMGEGDTKYSRKVLANSSLLVIICSILVYLLILPFRVPILQSFGASDITLSYAEPYFFTYLLGTPFALIAVGLNQFVICQGYSKAAMRAVIIGAVTNIVLDPVFIFVFDMGVRGAAIATVTSQIFSSLYVLRMLTRKHMAIRLEFSGYDLKIIKRIVIFGFCPFIIIAMDNLMIIAMNALLQNYGGIKEGDMLVTCATIVQSFMLIVTMPLSGISSGTQGLISFNYGACLIERVKKAYRFIILLCAVYTSIMFIFAWTISPYFVGLFTQNQALANEAIKAIHICTLFIIPLGVQYAIVDMFTAMGQVKFALSLSFWRKIIYFAALFILPAFFGARAIFFSEPISDILAPIVSIFIFIRFIDKILQQRLNSVKK